MSAGAYRRLLRSRGVPRMAMAFLVLGIGATMTPVAFVLFAHEATHSYASASLVLAAGTAGSIVFGPARGRLIDRLGSRAAVLRLVIPDIATDAAFIVTGRAAVGTGWLVAIAFVSGALTAPVAPAVRSLWSRTLDDDATRQAGFALMTMLQEASFIAGPLLAGILIALWSPTVAVAATAVLAFAGALVFATVPDTGPVAPAPRQSGLPRLPALAGRGIRTMLACAAAFGLSFGVLDVAFPAFARTHGSTVGAGVLLSAFAVGSFIGGFAYGLRSREGPSGPRYPWLCLLAAVGLAPLVLAPGLVAMAALAGVSGLCYAPVSTAQLAVIDEVAPSARRAEAFTWLGTIYGAGLALGAAVCGQLIAGAGIRAALAVACGATLGAAAVATVRAGTLRL